MIPPVYQLLTASAAVTDIVGDRVYGYGSAPQKATRPYVVWSVVSLLPENNLCCSPDTDRVTVVIGCWHQTEAGVNGLAEAVREAIEGDCYVTEIIADGYDFETRLYRAAIEVDFFVFR